MTQLYAIRTVDNIRLPNLPPLQTFINDLEHKVGGMNTNTRVVNGLELDGGFVKVTVAQLAHHGGGFAEHWIPIHRIQFVTPMQQPGDSKPAIEDGQVVQIQLPPVEAKKSPGRPKSTKEIVHIG